MSSQRNLGIHFFYVVLLLGLALVVMMTVEWTKLSGFTDYLNVAATITSLVLGVLAIIYAFVSTGSMSQFLGSIGQSTDQMTKVSGELRDLMVQGQKIQTQAESRTEQFQVLVSELSTNVNTLHSTTTAIKGTVDRIPRRLASLEKRISQTTSSDQVRPPTGTWTNAELTYFVKRSSLVGIAAVKLLLSAGAQSRFINPSAVFDASYFEYVVGFVMGVDASGLIEVSTPEEFDFTFKATENAPGLAAAVDAEWQARLSSDEQEEASGAREFEAKLSLALAPPAGV